MTATAFRRHAQAVLRDELRRQRGALARLPADRRADVEELIARDVAACVERVLEHARGDPLVAAALESVYGSRSIPTPVVVARD
jgi:hypothetical protein